jgi:hypothetical protein
LSDSARYTPSSSDTSYQQSAISRQPGSIAENLESSGAELSFGSSLITHHSSLIIRLSHVLFSVFLFLGLSIRSLWLRDGVPMKELPDPLPFLGSTLGSFALPIVACAAICVPWLAGRLLERPLRRWQWGRPAILLPLLGLSVVVLANLSLARATGTSLEIPKLLAFTWFVYLFAVNEHPTVTVPLALAVTVQGVVAVWQFVTQSDLGLQAIGERHLSTEVDGISILWVHDQAWIRSYGLTDHPNWLGATLSVCMLVLLSTFERLQGARRWAVGAAIAVAFLGLLVSFSRAAWIGFAVGLLLHVGWRLRARKGSGATFPDTRILAGALVLLALLFFMPFRDLVVSRVVIGDNPVEVRSVTDRLRDAAISLKLIADHPWRGIGTGEFLDTARALDPTAITVHNVTLLITAELGLPGLAFWLWLVAGSLSIGLGELGKLGGSHTSGALLAMVWLPPWIASLVIGMFDPNPSPFLMLTSALLFGLMVGSLSTVDSTTEAQRTQR